MISASRRTLGQTSSPAALASFSRRSRRGGLRKAQSFLWRTSTGSPGRTCSRPWGCWESCSTMDHRGGQRPQIHQKSVAKDQFSLLEPIFVFIRANEESSRKGGLVHDAWDAKRLSGLPLTRRRRHGAGWTAARSRWTSEGGDRQAHLQNGPNDGAETDCTRFSTRKDA